MIEYNDDEHSGKVTCDKDGEEHIFYNLFSFRDLINKLKENRWKIVYDEDLKKYYHYCPECRLD